MVRWAYRMLRSEWRQQLMVLGLLTVAVATATAGMAVASNSVPLRAGEFGDAQQRIDVDASDPAALAEALTAADHTFGTVEVVGHRDVTLPGTTDRLDLRAQDPRGPYGTPMLGRREGRYPRDDAEIALTDDVAVRLHVGLGDLVTLDGRPCTVVGTVENPANLDDSFALVATAVAPGPGTSAPPGDRVTLLVDAPDTELAAFEAAVELPPGSLTERGQTESTTAAMAALAASAVVLLFVALLASAGFVVVAHRRLRQLGMLAAVGATDRHIRLVLLANGALVGALAGTLGTTTGVLAWLGIAPRIETAVGHRVDVAAIPWGTILVGLLLATLASTLAAWWPAVAVTRVSVVDCLAARPPRPKLARHSAVLAVVLMAGGPVALVRADRFNVPLMVTGTLATVVGVLLLSPTAVRMLAALAGRVPVGGRLALRDLGRYQARSGAALAAISLGLGIPVAMVVVASAAQPGADEGNLSDRQLLVLVEGSEPGLGLVPQHAADVVAGQASTLEDLAARLGDATVVPLEVPVDPEVPTERGPAGTTVERSAVLGQPVGGTTRGRELYVATPQVLAYYGIDPESTPADAELLTAPPDQLWPNDDRQGSGPLVVQPPAAEDLAAEAVTIDVPGYTQAPISLITPEAVADHGWERRTTGWFVEADRPITGAELDDLRDLAADRGLAVDGRDPHRSLALLRTGATAVGMLVALSVLAMTVALIRSEARAEVHTLVATGASSWLQRTITGVSAGALALLGVALAVGAVYLTLVPAYASEAHRLERVPSAHLLVLAIGIPLVAAVSGWLVSGREPAALGRAPTD